MAGSSGSAFATQYEFELTAGREAISDVLNGVVDGNLIAISGAGYTREHRAKKGLRSVIENSPGAELPETPTN